MTKEELFAPIREKYNELKNAIEGTDIDKIRELTLEVHAMVHPAEISGRTEKTIADYVLDYMLNGNQNALVPREDYDVDLHYAGTRTVPMCWQFWHTYRIEDLVSNILLNLPECSPGKRPLLLEPRDKYPPKRYNDKRRPGADL